MKHTRWVLLAAIYFIPNGCKTNQAADSGSATKDAEDVAAAFLPMTVPYEWSCVVSARTDGDSNPMPPTKPQDYPSGKEEVYLALQSDTFYMDKTLKFLTMPDQEVPEIWVPDGYSAGPGYRRYKIKYSLRQELAIRSGNTAAPTPSFLALQFSGLLTSGYFSGSFFAIPVGGTVANKIIYDCYQKKWWPLAPSGW